MENDRPLLTVIAVCYNHAPYLVECLDSIRTQTYQDFELIVTDDGSTDASPDLIRGWLDRHRVGGHFIAHAQRRGLCPTLNEALAAVRGKYIAKIATDDVWLPRKLEHQLSMIESLPESVAVLYGDAYQINEAGKLLPRRYLSGADFDGRPPTGDIYLQLLRTNNFVLGVTTMLRTDSLRAVGGYDETLAYEDWDMWLRLAERFEFAFDDEVLAKYRSVATSMSHTLVRYGSPDRAWNDLLILEKCLGSAKLGARARIRSRLRMIKCALTLVRHLDPRAGLAIERALVARV